MLILEIKSKKLVTAKIVPANKSNIPKLEDGWNFNWKGALKQKNTNLFILVNLMDEVQGAISLKNDGGMLIMDILELSPTNIGKNKKYNYVAGCLIAFACRKAISLRTDYKGFLVFISKTDLVELYKNKYYATQTIGQRMYIDPNSGEKLIEEYLNRKK